MNELMNPETTSFLERVVRDPAIDVVKLEQIIALQERVADKQAQQAFNAAMARVEAEIGPVIRDRLNPGVNRKYATLEAIDAVARPVYSAHGLSVRFGCAAAPSAGWLRLTCTVSHADGYSEQTYLDSPVDTQQRSRSPVQAVGSTLTYLRRYLLQNAFNIVLSDDETDDDGEVVPMRAAAASMPRTERVADPTVYQGADPLDEPDGRKWMDNLTRCLANAQTQQEVVELANHSSVGNATANAPEAVKRRLTELLANAYGRFAEPSDELPELEIAGAEKAASG
jgi:hypothetical protein